MEIQSLHLYPRLWTVGETTDQWLNLGGAADAKFGIGLLVLLLLTVLWNVFSICHTWNETCCLLTVTCLEETLPDVVLSIIATRGCCQHPRNKLTKTHILASYSSPRWLQLIGSVVTSWVNTKLKQTLWENSIQLLSHYNFKNSSFWLQCSFLTVCPWTLIYLASWQLNFTKSHKYYGCLPVSCADMTFWPELLLLV